MKRLWIVLPVTLAACSGSGAIRKGEGESESEAEAEQECRENEMLVGSACVPIPTTESVRTSCGEITEHCDPKGEDRPDFSCLTDDPPLAADGPQTVTVSGFVEVFGNGPDADGVKIQIFDAAELDQAASAAKDDGRLDGSWILDATEAGEITLLGETVEVLRWKNHSLPPENCRACPNEDDARDGIPCAVPTTDCDVVIDWDVGEWCLNGQRLQDRQRWECRYEIADIPTNRYLAIRTAGENELSDLSWSSMLETNVYLFADSERIVDGAYELAVKVLHRTDYASIPRTVIGAPIPPGHGAIAGETRDCDDARVSFARVGIFPAPQATTYFNGNPFDPLPELSRAELGTAADGIYAGVNVAAGPVEVAALAKQDGEIVALGAIAGTVLPDTVTVVVFAERKPTQ